MQTFAEALDQLCRIPDSIAPDQIEERIEFCQPQTEFSGDIVACPQVAAVCELGVRSIIRLMVDQGLAPDLMPVGREAYLNGLILGVSIGVRMERQEP
jgi:hypothetical protein